MRQLLDYFDKLGHKRKDKPFKEITDEITEALNNKNNYIDNNINLWWKTLTEIYGCPASAIDSLLRKESNKLSIYNPEPTKYIKKFSSVQEAEDFISKRWDENLNTLDSDS